MARIVSIVSGGIESLAIMALMRAGNHESHCFFVDYGQRAADQERRAVRSAARYYGLHLEEHRIEAPFLSELALTSDTLNWCYEGVRSLDDPVNTAEAAFSKKESRGHIVPYRNMFILALASSYANIIDADHIWTGFDYLEGNKGAANDKSPAFVDAFNSTIASANENGAEFTIEAPLQGNTKAQTIELGLGHDVDWGLSWSCYNAYHSHCGICGACVSRRAGFDEADVGDPVRYMSKDVMRDEWRSRIGTR